MKGLLVSALPDCPTCRPWAEKAILEGKAGYVMCVACMDKNAADNARREEQDNARERAWRTARELAPDEDRLVASAVMMAAERDVLRRLVCAQLPGGEVEYWRLVEQEMKR